MKRKAWKPPSQGSVVPLLRENGQFLDGGQARYQWLMPVILATWEAEIRRIEVYSQLRQRVCHTPSPK
jgi:hypothetical protein